MQIEPLLQSMIERAGARTIYGEPVQAEGRTLIPVARIAYGFGMGSGRKGEGEEGGGAGGGFTGQPVGVVEVSAAGTRFISIGIRRKMAAALALGFVLGLAVSRRRVHVTVEKPRK